jgi:hypothetical protein
MYRIFAILLKSEVKLAASPADQRAPPMGSVPNSSKIDVDSTGSGLLSVRRYGP